jgi:hypothetical protein
VQETGFRRYLQRVDPRAYPPGQRIVIKMLRVIRKLVVKKIRVVLAASKKECNGEPFISCIIDLWSQRNAKRSFVNMNS